MQKLFPYEIRQLPKVELHRHLDCSMRWSTVLDVAAQVGIKLDSNLLSQRQQFLVTGPMLDLQAVLSKFTHAQKVLASEQILERLAYEACEDAVNDGIFILELRYAPTFIADGHPLSYDQIHAALLRGVAKAEAKWPLAVGLICIIQRIKSVQVAQSVVDFTINNKDSFVGLDLADNEDGFEVRPFAPLFAKAKAAGLKITCHSGEIPHPQSAQWIEDSIEILGAERIGHGVQVVHSPPTIKKLIDRKIPLEICPYSNYLTQAFASHAEHPLRKLLDAGVLVTINSDDPGVFASTLSDDYQLAHDVHGFGIRDFQKCNHVAFDHSFIKNEKKERFKNLFA